MDVLDSIGQATDEADDPRDQGVEEVEESVEETTVDGRSLRRQRNRDAVVEAAFELIGERRTTPTIDEVAENIDAIRDESRQWLFPQQTGFADHLARSFEMARRG